MKTYCIKFDGITINDISRVGGKNASLGEMYTKLTSNGIKIPDGFATTADAFWEFLEENNIETSLKSLLTSLDRQDFANLAQIGVMARSLILKGTFSKNFITEITTFYRELSKGGSGVVAVRSSATAEDLPEASFAGQHDSFLNIRNEKSLLQAVKKCFASLYTDRAIKYREDKEFEHDKIALSVGVQRMVRSDKGCSGVGFTIEPESGFQNIIHLSGVWGLGENIVQGTINPDEFYVFKPTLELGKNAIVQKILGDKEKTMVYSELDKDRPTVNQITKLYKRKQFVLSDQEVTTLAKWALIIEQHYGKAMDIEWAKDGLTKELFITQARPETVHHSKRLTTLLKYTLENRSEILAVGNAIGSKISVGVARVLRTPKDSHKLQEGDIIVTDITSPDWDPLLKKAGGIVTNRGGRTSHAAIVARELGVPAVVGTNSATRGIKDGELITLSCAEGKTGYVYKGKLSFKRETVDISLIKLPKTEAKLILSDPERAFQLSFYPNDGVGLLRMEFIITHMIKVHPMALVKYDKLSENKIKKQITQLTENYPQKKDYFIDLLSQGIATIAAAFYPKEVIVRMSDFKTNEYANLIGGIQFEPKEENPMLGFRGASRYYSTLYKEGFELECAAIEKVRNEMGLTNVKVMIPFCRTVEEGKKVIDIMKGYGLQKGENGLEVYVMSEIPSNILLAEEFAEVFDGFSIGSNDLTQLTMGIDRDSVLMASIFDENNAAVKKMIRMAIQKANKTGKKIGLCGQAPSDFADYASFLVAEGIHSISFNPDALLKGIENINLAESQTSVITNQV
ncbi:phosphoenolpyruvate synthase [Aquimarina sp. 2-A2]|uniref:phosphoenolpyruvate synthase n=1 Tax=Aquimarina sp. 2-A2 TaxID=3382644 RepID=UPI00387EEE5B